MNRSIPLRFYNFSDKLSELLSRLTVRRKARART